MTLETKTPDEILSPPETRDRESFLKPNYAEKLSDEEYDSWTFSQFDRLSWNPESIEETTQLSMDLLKRMSELFPGHSAQRLRVLWNPESNEYLIQNLFSKVTRLDQELNQAQRGFIGYEAELTWDKETGQTTENFQLDERWNWKVNYLRNPETAGPVPPTIYSETPPN